MAKINFTITKAKKEQICVKVLVSGPSGSGKSYSALRLATGIAGRVGEGTKIGYIGTEGMRDKLYANEFDYDLISLEEYSPDYYIAALDAFLDAQYKVIIIDSMTHLSISLKDNPIYSSWLISCFVINIPSIADGLIIVALGYSLIKNLTAF